jgi:hypothetical protein
MWAFLKIFFFIPTLSSQIFLAKNFNPVSCVLIHENPLFILNFTRKFKLIIFFIFISDTFLEMAEDEESPSIQDLLCGHSGSRRPGVNFAGPPDLRGLSSQILMAW